MRTIEHSSAVAKAFPLFTLVNSPHFVSFAQWVARDENLKGI